jgi:hypothetical protein
LLGFGHFILTRVEVAGTVHNYVLIYKFCIIKAKRKTKSKSEPFHFSFYGAASTTIAGHTERYQLQSYRFNNYFVTL